MVRKIQGVREDFDQGQKRFILDNAPDPGDREAVFRFCRRFKLTYGLLMNWDEMRSLITKLRRKKRRQGNGEENGENGDSRYRRGPVRRHRSRR